MNKWDTYYLYDSTTKIKKFWDEYYKDKNHNSILIILGKGFDPRMNNILKIVVEKLSECRITCLTFDFPAGHATSIDDLYEKNVEEFGKIIETYNIREIKISLDPEKERQRRIKGMCRDLAGINLACYSDIIIDVSALPQSLYFNITKVVYEQGIDSQNVFLAVSENVYIDKNIHKQWLDEEIPPLYGFSAGTNRTAQVDQQRILIPLIGEGQVNELIKIYQSFDCVEVCPILPFPSKIPRRSDNLLIEYRNFLEERVHIEPQDITYVDERNPFELYRILTRMIQEYVETLKPISKNVTFGIALLSNKLQSLGALLVGLEYNKSVAIYNVVSTHYSVANKDVLCSDNEHSENYLLWIKGEAYNE